MQSKFLPLVAVAALTIGCADSDTNPSATVKDHATAADSGRPAAREDSGAAGPAIKQVDASPATSSCTDDPAIPGNECDDAVGCREAPVCGLAAQSCCVPGFDVPNVNCIDGLVCPEGAGRANCDGPEDCGGRACCVDIQAGATTCLDSCEGKLGLCHTDADCASGQTCSQGKSFTWWGICG